MNRCLMVAMLVLGSVVPALAGCLSVMPAAPTSSPVTVIVATVLVRSDCGHSLAGLSTPSLVLSNIEEYYPEYAPSRHGAEWPLNGPEPGPDEGGVWMNDGWTITRNGDRVTARDKTTGFHWSGIIVNKRTE